MTNKIAVTFCIVLYALVVPFLEINNTHLFNPDWTPHVRIHEAWQLITNSGLGLFCLWLVWFKNQIFVSAVISLFITGGFLLVYVLRDNYGGSMVMLDGSEVKLLGMNIGALGFGIAVMLLFFVIISEKLKNNSN